MRLEGCSGAIAGAGARCDKSTIDVTWLLFAIPSADTTRSFYTSNKLTVKLVWNSFYLILFKNILKKYV